MHSASVILGLVTISSVSAYLLGARRLGLAPARLWAATLRTMEIAGTAVLFCLVNLALGLATMLAWRVAARGFVSVYLLNDVSLLVLSALQALMFDSWRRQASHDPE